MVCAVLAAPGHISIIPFVFATLFSTSPVCSPSFVYCKSVDSEDVYKRQVYELTKKDSTYEQIQSETVIDNSDGEAYNNALFGYDNPKAPSVTAYTVNASINNKIVAPYQIAFGHWNNLASSVFDFEPDNSLTFTNPYNEKYLTADSAYALYFDMGSVAANGEGNTVATNYGKMCIRDRA